MNEILKTAGTVADEVAWQLELPLLRQVVEFMNLWGLNLSLQDLTAQDRRGRRVEVAEVRWKGFCFQGQCSSLDPGAWAAATRLDSTGEVVRVVVSTRRTSPILSTSGRGGPRQGLKGDIGEVVWVIATTTHITSPIASASRRPSQKHVRGGRGSGVPMAPKTYHHRPRFPIYGVSLLASTTMSTFAKASFNAASYSSGRPTYPPKLFEYIFKYYKNQPEQCTVRWDRAADIGCGTGTSLKSYPDSMFSWI